MKFYYDRKYEKLVNFNHVIMVKIQRMGDKPTLLFTTTDEEITEEVEYTSIGTMEKDLDELVAFLNSEKESGVIYLGETDE